MALSEAAQRQIEASNVRKGAWFRGEAPLVDSRFGARTIGDLALLDIGCSAWARLEGNDKRLDWHGEARGGLILDVIDTVTTVDKETGEVRRDRSFRCWNYINRRTDVLTEAQLNRDGCEPFEPGLATRTLRGFSREIGARDRALLSAGEAQQAIDIGRLAALLMQDRH